MDPQNDTPESPTSRKRLFVIGGLASLLALIVLPSAFARGGGHGFGGHGCDRNQNAEQIQAKSERMLDHVLDRVDATEEQRAEALVLVEGLGERVVNHRAERADVRAQWQDALTAEVIDDKQLEALRQDLVERVDEGSSEVLGLVADLASILSPEQRAELADTVERWH